MKNTNYILSVHCAPVCTYVGLPVLPVLVSFVHPNFRLAMFTVS